MPGAFFLPFSLSPTLSRRERVIIKKPIDGGVKLRHNILGI
jgi:hypothetical protein